jgi:hypothetical protein
MPVVWSLFPDLCSKIWEFLGFLSCQIHFERFEWKMTGRTTVSSNKAASCGVLKILVLALLSLAGRGGGGSQSSAIVCVSVLWPAVVAGGEGETLQRKEYRRQDGVGMEPDERRCSWIPRRHGGERDLKVSVFAGLQVLVLREVEAQCFLCASEAVLCGGVHQPRPLYAEAILGRRRPSALGCCPSFFFLRWKILDLAAGISAGLVPSGPVPGGVAGAHAARSSASCGGDEALDCVLVYLSEGFCVKCKDYVVISGFFRVALVICNPTAG